MCLGVEILGLISEIRKKSEADTIKAINLLQFFDHFEIYRRKIQSSKSKLLFIIQLVLLSK
jgi:hypothetical protein